MQAMEEAPPLSAPKAKTIKEKPHYEIVTKAQAITMRLEGATWEKIELKTGISRRAVYRFLSEARKRGFDPENNVPLTSQHLKEKPRPGRPRKLDEETERKLMEEVSGQRGKTAKEVAAPLSVSRRTIQRAFKRHNTTFEEHRAGEKAREAGEAALSQPEVPQLIQGPPIVQEQYRDLSAILSPNIEKAPGSIYPSPYAPPPGPYSQHFAGP